MLILAGISIATLTGENGLLTKVNTAKEQTEIADAKEQAKIDIAAEIAERIEAGRSTDLTDSDIQNILTNKDYVKEAKDTSFTTKKSGYEIPYSDLYNSSTGKQPPIPDDFYPVGGTIEEGFVISDVEGDDLDNSLQGNQFVWVPVPNIEKFKPIEGYFNKKLEFSGANCYEPSKEEYQYGAGDGIEESEEVKDYKAMKKSVQENKGFYIGRFEAGKDENDNKKVIVQKGATVYNDILWGKSMTDITGGAVEKARNFAKENGYTSVTSTLCYGVQWDATMQFMDSKYLTGECEEDSYVRNSEEKGWYDTDEDPKDGPTKTGYYEYKHIYDMAGNVAEWTMEAYDNGYRIFRGGYYYNDGSKYPASVRYNNPPYSYDFTGFRLALYL